MSDLAEYYATRGREYDEIYRKPERQSDLARLAAVLPELLRARQLLEIACGTGYWTARLAPSARSVVAIDCNIEVLSIASARLAGHDTVSLIGEDAFSLNSVAANFDGAFAGFWYSHLRRDQRRPFFDHLHRKLQPGSLVVLLDNRFVAGSSTPLSRTDSDGNTYQIRTVAHSARQYEVLKNFPSQQQFIDHLPANVSNVSFNTTRYYWYAHYQLR